jgi:hypothetical protein
MPFNTPKIGTEIGTGRLSTGRDGTGSPAALIVEKPEETSPSGPRQDEPARHQAHFEDRSGTSIRRDEPVRETLLVLRSSQTIQFVVRLKSGQAPGIEPIGGESSVCF